MTKLITTYYSGWHPIEFPDQESLFNLSFVAVVQGNKLPRPALLKHTENGKTNEEQVEKKTQEINKQIKAMHRADKFRVQIMDRHLCTLSFKKGLEQLLDRKQKWVDFVTIAYEALMEQKETLTSTCQQHTLNQSKNVGRRPQV